MYQQEWHFSPITTTVIFGVYAVAILLALLVVGSLSDHAGRRPVIFGSIVAQAAVVVFAGVDGVPALLCARILQGLATGTVGRCTPCWFHVLIFTGLPESPSS
ncbi:MFS transporter [Streptomyces sp. NPDC048342]|uniref:MFS transporter n=1 Tax=unclassified Streptomyces TaxID=2593676 RepID=UPI0034423C14